MGVQGALMCSCTCKCRNCARMVATFIMENGMCRRQMPGLVRSELASWQAVGAPPVQLRSQAGQEHADGGQDDGAGLQQRQQSSCN